MPADGGDCDEELARFESAGIGVQELAARLQEEGKKAFADSWADMLESIETEREKVA
jgi:hypothetical protein